MTYILQIDTSGNESTVALSGDGGLLHMARRTDTRDHASVIHGMVGDVLGDAGISFPQLHAVAVCAGPGSYTGLRIGLSVAKGFCYALDIPLLLQHKLHLLAHQYRLPGQTNQLYLLALQARTNEYFAACYDAVLQAVWQPQHMMRETLIEYMQQVGKPCLFITDLEFPEQEFSQESGVAGLFDFVRVAQLDPVAWSVLAYEGFLKGDSKELSKAEPFYMKDVFINKKL